VRAEDAVAAKAEEVKDRIFRQIRKNQIELRRAIKEIAKRAAKCVEGGEEAHPNAEMEKEHLLEDFQ
jgi:hypothetical protein